MRRLLAALLVGEAGGGERLKDAKIVIAGGRGTGARDNWHLIEEAADVHRHRLELVRSERRLTETRDNLGHVRMLVKEVEPRLRSLDRQAARAERYKTLHAELSEVLQVYYEHELRTAQEALTNVARHSRASHVEISIKSRDKQMMVRIKDDGRGIKESELQDKKSFGLIGMRERVQLLRGKLSITGEPNKGTIIAAEIPIIK